MTTDSTTNPNVREVVPFFWVSGMERSLRYYMEGLGFTIKYQWAPDGKLRWCWLTLGGASLMLQEFWTDGHHAGRPEGNLGQGVSLNFTCQDAIAIYREVTSRGIISRIQPLPAHVRAILCVPPGLHDAARNAVIAYTHRMLMISASPHTRRIR